jgi:hypothetical protein
MGVEEDDDPSGPYGPPPQLRWGGNPLPNERGPAGPRFLDSDRTDQTGMFCCATMQYSMPIENMVLKRLA